MKRIILLIIFVLVLSPLFVFAEGVQLDVTVTAPPVSGGGGGGGSVSTYTTVIIKGMAYPKSFVTILKDGQVATTTQADPWANFEVTLGTLTAGVWTFSLWAEDNQGRRSHTYSFTTNLASGVTTTISNIFLAPTIMLDKETVQRGDNIGILGQTAPKSEVAIYVYSADEPIVKKVQADLTGAYFHNFDTTPLVAGVHNTKAKSTSEGGMTSDFSASYAFVVSSATETPVEPEAPARPVVVEIPVVGVPFQSISANVNEDFTASGANVVDIVDVSILLYNWGIPQNPKADVNKDNIVDLTDFSIMLYYWTGSI